MHKRGRTPTILQLDAAECGAASLGMVLAAHGRFMALDELRRLCGVSRDGSKASSLVRAGRMMGMTARGMKAEPHHLADMPKPLIAFVNFNHFLVVEDVDSKHVWVNDPASGRRKESIEEFSESFTGVALTFVPDDSFERGDSRPSLLPSLRARFSGLEPALWFVTLASLALVIPGVIIPVFSRIFVDQVLIRALGDWLPALLAGMAITALVRFILLELQGQALVRVRTGMMRRTGTQLMTKLMQLPIGFFDQRFAGEIADRVQLNEKLSELLTGRLAQAAVSLITALFLFVALLIYHWGLTLIVLTLAAANAAVLMLSTNLLSERYRKLSIERGKLFGARVAGLNDMETFKASGAEDLLFKRWTGLSINAQNSQQSANALASWINPLPAMIGTLASVAILLFGGLAVMNGTLTIGGLVGYQSLAASILAPVAALAGFGAELQQIRSYTERLDDVLCQTPDPRFASAEDAMLRTTAPRGAITLEAVSFGYAPLDPPLVDGLSLSIAPGERIALVGPSGSGKSTVGKLIGGLETPTAGRVLLDGAPLFHWPAEVLGQRLAYVRQEVVLFAGSIRDNLSLWDDSLADADILSAAKDAQIHDLIASRPGGYDAPVIEGATNFSGGERQRLEIARALATRPNVIILDEATSALDPVTEYRVMEAIRRRGITCVVVAHRLSTIRDCDRILLLDRGKVAEIGTHAELMATRGLYARLISA